MSVVNLVGLISDTPLCVLMFVCVSEWETCHLVGPPSRPFKCDHLIRTAARPTFPRQRPSPSSPFNPGWSSLVFKPVHYTLSSECGTTKLGFQNLNKSKPGQKKIHWAMRSYCDLDTTEFWSTFFEQRKIKSGSWVVIMHLFVGRWRWQGAVTC